MLPSLPQMYRKNIIQAIKMRPSALFLFCRGEPTGTLMRDYCFDTCCHLQRTLARTVPKLVALSAYPRAYGPRTLPPYLRTLARTAPEACHSICIPSRVRFGRFHPLQRTFILVSTHLIAPLYIRS